MKKNYNLIIADSNRRVREFLNREMILVGYHVVQAKNGIELINQLDEAPPKDLLIVDPDFPDTEEGMILAEITERFPLLPIIVHAYSFNTQIIATSCNTIIFVEKRGNSIEVLKQHILNILQSKSE